MTLGDGNSGPGQGTAPALRMRDFDGGLLSRLSYSLTAADAYAYLRQTEILSRRSKFALAALFVASGAAIEMLAPSGIGPLSETQTLLALVAVELALLWLARWLWLNHRARRMIPHPRPAVFEEWVDCIAITALDEPEEIYLSPELIGPIVQSRTHVFVFSGSQCLLVPTRALDDPTAFTDHLRALAKGPYYFDP